MPSICHGLVDVQMRQPRENLFHLKQKLHNSGEQFSFFLRTQPNGKAHIYTQKEKSIDSKHIKTKKECIFFKNVFFNHHSQGDQLWILEKVCLWDFSFLFTDLSQDINSITNFVTKRASMTESTAHLDCSLPHTDKCLRFEHVLSYILLWEKVFLVHISLYAWRHEI